MQRPLCSSSRSSSSRRSSRRSSSREEPQEEPQEEPAGTGEAQEGGETVVNEQGETIYLGFDKSDTTPRTGRKGRTIVDDAERYPSRSELVGGRAGGEVGLQQFVEVAVPHLPQSHRMRGCRLACSACVMSCMRACRALDSPMDALHGGGGGGGRRGIARH